VATFRSALERAVAVDDYVDYHDAFEYFQGIDEMIDEIDPLLTDDPAGVAELAEYAIPAIEEAADTAVDDSAGHTSDVLERLVALHLAACRKAKLPPGVLGPRLLVLELSSSYAAINVVDRYAKVLGTRDWRHTAPQQRRHG
jgi:hypothetical protein